MSGTVLSASNLETQLVLPSISVIKKKKKDWQRVAPVHPPPEYIASQGSVCKNKQKHHRLVKVFLAPCSNRSPLT